VPLAIPNHRRLLRPIPASSVAAMWGNRSAPPSASIWPWGFIGFVAIASELRPVDLALEARSAPAGLAGASAPASRCLRWYLRRLVGWTASLQPRRRPQVPCLAVRPWARCRSSPSQPLDGAFTATTVAAPTVSPPWSSSSLLCELTCEFYSFSLVSALLSWWPGQQARHACLLLLRHAWACDAVLELLCWPLPTAAVSFSARFS
jgi:hypothetical protein